MKKNAVDNIVPIVIALKHKLEKAKSPLIDDLVSGQVCPDPESNPGLLSLFLFFSTAAPINLLFISCMCLCEDFDFDLFCSP